jgi:hypothetical protein
MRGGSGAALAAKTVVEGVAKSRVGSDAAIKRLSRVSLK